MDRIVGSGIDKMFVTLLDAELPPREQLTGLGCVQHAWCIIRENVSSSYFLYVNHLLTAVREKHPLCF